MEGNKVKQGMSGRGRGWICYWCENLIVGQNYEEHIGNHTEETKNSKFSNCFTDMCQTICKICGKLYTLYTIRKHTRLKHQMAISEYKLKFNQHIFDIVEKYFHICGICQLPILLDLDVISVHLLVYFESHNMTCKQYSESYLSHSDQDFPQNTNKEQIQKFKYKENATNNRQFTCDQCSYETNNPKWLRAHFYKQHDIMEFCCDICDFKALKKSKLSDHLRYSHRGLSFICQFCSQEFCDRVRLRKHIKGPCLEYRNDGHSFDCEQCDLKFYRPDRLLDHVKTFHLKITYQCTECTENFKRKDRLNEHIETKHNGLTYDCEQCMKRFGRKDILDTHNKSYHLGVIYKCNECQREFKRKDKLNEHINKSHNDHTEECFLCMESCIKEISMKKHLKSKMHKSNLSLKMFLNSHFPCTKCESILKSESGLKDHLVKNHSVKFTHLHNTPGLPVQKEIITTTKGNQSVHIGNEEPVSINAHIDMQLEKQAKTVGLGKKENFQAMNFKAQQDIGDRTIDEKLLSDSFEPTFDDNLPNTNETITEKETDIKGKNHEVSLPTGEYKSVKSNLEFPKLEEKVSLEESLDILNKITSDFIRTRRLEDAQNQIEKKAEGTKENCAKNEDTKLTQEKHKHIEVSCDKAEISNMDFGENINSGYNKNKEGRAISKQNMEMFNKIKMVEASLKGEHLFEFRKIVRKGINTSNFKHTLNNFKIRLKTKVMKHSQCIRNIDTVTID